MAIEAGQGAATPWYTFKRVDQFGTIDPQGQYWKPDSNILTPSGYPVTALLSGTVTSVQATSWGQTVVTVRLDNALNNLATHTFYEHMHDATVQVGQHLDAGTLLGHANYTGEGAPLGFGLYSGDVYGSGPAWAQSQSDLAPGGANLLNPTKLLDAASQGKVGQMVSTQGQTPSIPGDVSGITNFFQKIGAALPWFTSPTRILKMITGITLIAIALLLMVVPDLMGRLQQGGEKMATEQAKTPVTPEAMPKP